MTQTLFRRKSIALVTSHSELKRTMSRWALLLFSVGAIIGSGIFVILGMAIQKAGPAVMLSFLIAAFAALLSAFSYAEMASSVPASGSSYSYAYVTLGEIVAWAVGWMLILEYGVSAAAVAVAWGEYLNALLQSFGLAIPTEWTNSPAEGGRMNLPAACVVLACGLLLVRGVSESAWVNTTMVLMKVAILLFFCAVAFTAVDTQKLTPFAPLGTAGVLAAAGQVFFSYIGFDAASTAGEEARDPQRDLPFAIIGSLTVVTALYLMVALATVGNQDWQDFAGQGSEAVLAQIANRVVGGSWAGNLIASGAVISIFSVVLVAMYGQTRILFAMARDGLLPSAFRRVDPRTQTPVLNTLIVMLLAAGVAALVPLGLLAEATSIGTLGAFAVVNVGVMVLRRQQPQIHGTFRMPLYPWVPLLALVMIGLIVANLDATTWAVFALWMAGGFALYFMYARKHSALSRPITSPYTKKRA